MLALYTGLDPIEVDFRDALDELLDCGCMGGGPAHPHVDRSERLAGSNTVGGGR